MSLLRALLGRVQGLFRAHRVEREIAEELSFHIEQLAQDNIRRGMTPDEARREADRQFGHVAQIREQGYEARGGGWLESFIQDLIYGCRVLRRNPAFAATGIITLALGIGVNTALFTIVESVLLRPLPYVHPEQLFVVREKAGPATGIMRVSGPDFNDIHDQSRSFDKVAEIIAYFTYSMTGEGEPRNVKCTAINQDFFPTLGIKPLIGRLYIPEEYHQDYGTTVISERFWKEQLGGDPHVIGKVLTFQGTPEAVIGVMPDLPDFLPETDVWAKIVPEYDFMHWRQNKFLSVVGKLKPDVSPRQAEQELTAILRRGQGQPAGLEVKLSPLQDELVGKVSTELKIAMGAVLVVLLIACVNIMGLLLARSSERGAEIAMRVSLGASRGRILRQLITENLILVVTGSLLGLALAEGLVELARNLNLGNLPRASQIRLDSHVIAVLVVVALALSLVLAWGPSRMFSRTNFSGSLKTGRAEVRRPRLFRLLVITEMGCAIVLLVAAGLLLRSFWMVEHVDPGFDPGHVLTTFLRTQYYSAEGGAFYEHLMERIEHAPAVEGVAVADCLPASKAAKAELRFDDRPNDPGKQVYADGCWTSPSFFTTLGTPLTKGRLFTAHDNATASPVAIINEAMAQEFWPGRDPIGRRIAVSYTGPGRKSTGEPRFREIVGVVADMKLKALDVSVSPALYMPFEQDETNHVYAGMSLFVRTLGQPAAAAGTVRREIHDFKADQALAPIYTMDDVISSGLAQRRFSMGLLSSFALLALSLAAVGIYGTIAFSLSQRTRELGVRIALGATPQSLLRMIVTEGLRFAATGVVLGVCLSLLLTRLIRNMLFRVGEFDPLTFIAVSVVLVAIAAIATFLPARKAALADPIKALRAE